MASLTRRLRERSVSLGILPSGWLAVVTGLAAAVVPRCHGRFSGTVPGRRAQRYRLWEERGER
jgi:hypothetical protein